MTGNTPLTKAFSGVGADRLLLAACMLLLAILLLPLRGAMTDDTYIHMQYARNLSERGELAFNAGERAYGATSPLWVLLLAAARALGGDLESWSGILSRFFAFASVLIVFRLAFFVDGRRATAFAAGILMASEAWLVRWSSVGMETSLAVFMVAAALLASMKAGRSPARSALFGLVLFLACLARPETLLLAVLGLLCFLAAGGGMPFGRRFGWLLVFAPLFAAWLFLMKSYTGTFFPLTAGAKQGEIAFSGALFSRALVPARILGATVALPMLAFIASLAWGLARRGGITGAPAPEARPGILLGTLWIFALPAAYVIMDFQVLSRYMLPVSPAVIVFGTAAAARLAERFSSRRNAATAAVLLLAAAGAVQNIVFYSIVVVRPTREFSEGLETVVAGMGRWLAENSEPGAVIAAPDIGAVGYFSERRILDLGGLVSPRINEMRSSMDADEIITEGLYLELGADYLMDRSAPPARFDGRVVRGVRFTQVLSGTVSNLGIRKQEPVLYVLYRLSGEDGER